MAILNLRDEEIEAHIGNPPIFDPNAGEFDQQIEVWKAWSAKCTMIDVLRRQSAKRLAQTNPSTPGTAPSSA